MFAERLVIDLPDLAAAPPWVWWAVAAAVWYPVAGRVIYHMRRKDVMRGDGDGPTPPQAYACLWVFSPAAVVILSLMAVTVGAIFTLWAVGHYVSLGAIPAPWEKAKPAGGKLIPPQGGSSSAPPSDPPTAGELGL